MLPAGSIVRALYHKL